KVRRQNYGHLADATLSYDHCRGGTRTAKTSLYFTCHRGKKCSRLKTRKGWNAKRRPSPYASSRLLELDLGACVFQLLLDGFSVSLRDAFLDGLRCAINEVLGFLQAQAGSGADDLNDFNLLVASGSQNDGEVGLFFSSSSAAGSSASSRSG